MTRMVYQPEEGRILFPDHPWRQLFREDECVYKIDEQRLNHEWHRRIARILHIWQPHLLLGCLFNGYVTQYVDGTDLHGNTPFNIDGKNNSVIPLSPSQIEGVHHIFNKCTFVGEQTGYTFGDVTCGNMMTNGQHVYLIDFDVVTTWPLEKKFQNVWDNTKRLIFG